MGYFNIGNCLDGYQIIMEYADIEKSLCIGKKGNEYAVFATEDNFKFDAYTMLTKEEAKYLLLKKSELNNIIEEFYNNANKKR